MSGGPAASRVPVSGDSPAQEMALQLYGDAAWGRVRLDDPMACEARLAAVRGAKPNLNDAAAGRRHAIAILQRVMRRLAAAGHAGLDEIERATTAGPDAHPAALQRLTELLTGALAFVPPEHPPGASP